MEPLRVPEDPAILSSYREEAYRMLAAYIKRQDEAEAEREKRRLAGVASQVRHEPPASSVMHDSHCVTV
jgi:hypothetical protein